MVLYYDFIVRIGRNTDISGEWLKTKEGKEQNSTIPYME